eukprot:SM004943S17372  [mRNA]  locus=s4943:3:1018:- [translate_table: standard]
MLSNMAYWVPGINAGDLWRKYRLRMVTSSLAEREAATARESRARLAVEAPAAASSPPPWRGGPAGAASSPPPPAAVIQAEEAAAAAVEAADEEERWSSACPSEWFVCDDVGSGTRYIAIQGSVSLASWQANLSFDPVAFENPALGVMVHRGTYEAAKALYAQVLPTVQAHVASRGAAGARLRLTG